MPGHRKSLPRATPPFPGAASRVDAVGLSAFVRRVYASCPPETITYLCIGTDRSTGDCLGPLVGTLLSERGMPRVIGTLKHPCDAARLPCIVGNLPETGIIIAIDACLGKPEAVGQFVVSDGPLTPARATGGACPPVGDYSIAGIVNEAGPKPYWTLQSTSLYRVMGMAGAIADALSANQSSGKDEDI